MGHHYRALSGRRYELGALTAAERAFLEEVFALYRQRPAWDEFRRRWVALGRERLWGRKVAVGSAPYRICQDLAARLGIAEGKLAPPDYRDRLADLIDERFGSRAAFCKATGLDPGHLSRVLAGQKHLASSTLFEVLSALGVELELVEPEELVQRAQNPFGPPSLAERLCDLERRVSDLKDLLARAADLGLEQQAELVRRATSSGARPDPEDPCAPLRIALSAALAERASVASELAALAERERAAHR